MWCRRFFRVLLLAAVVGASASHSDSSMEAHKVQAQIEMQVMKAIRSGVELDGIERALRSALTRVENAQAEALLVGALPMSSASLNRKRQEGHGPAHGQVGDDVIFDKDTKLNLAQFTELARAREGDMVSTQHIEKIFRKRGLEAG